MKNIYNLANNLFKIEDEISRCNLNTKLKDNTSELKFLKYLKKQKLENNIMYSGFLLYFIGHNLNLIYNLSLSKNTVASVFFTALALVVDVILTTLLIKLKMEASTQRIIKHTKALLYILMSTFLIITLKCDCINENSLKISKYFIMLIVNYIGYIIFWDDSFIFALILALFHEILLTFLFFKQENSPISFSEMIITMILSIFSCLLKRNKEFILRRMFIEKFKFKKYFKYYDNFISNLNGFHFSYVNKDIAYVNKNFN